MKIIKFFISLFAILTVTFILTTWASYSKASPIAVEKNARQGTISVPESNDFATRVLMDPWDMSEFTDISRYLNNSGQLEILKNINVVKGVFSATSVNRIDQGVNANFSVLFPGYESAIKVGKDGALNPIDSSIYQCLYIAMKVETGAPNEKGPGPDQHLIFWFGDDRLNTGGAPWGQTSGIWTYPEFGPGTPVPFWRVFKVDLANPPSPGAVGTPWTDQPTWQGVRIDPTIHKDVDFDIDWVRLTDCDPVDTTLTWTPNAGVEAIWIRSQNGEGNTEYIQIQKVDSGMSGMAQLDTQGIAAGTYEIAVGSEISCCVQSNIATLTVDPAPLVDFARPSFTSGADYASQAGNPWDFTDTTDATSIQADVGGPGSFSSNFTGDELEIITESGPLPAGNDIQVKLNTPETAASDEYRYLTFRMHTEWNEIWENAPDGMIVRWVWSVQGHSGDEGKRCHLVSHDIPFDVGWQTYTIDLFNTFNGEAEEKAGQCDGVPTYWGAPIEIIEMRFDPNENVTVANNSITKGGGPFTQRLDWIKLTQSNAVSKGNPYTVQISLSEPPESMNSVNFYYTDDLNNPKKFAADEYSPPDPIPPAGDQFVYLPTILKEPNGTIPDPEPIDPVPNEVRFEWDTSSVNAGEYYLCAEVDDGFNINVQCSEASINVTAP